MKSKLYGGCRWAVTVGYDPFIFCLFRIKIFQIHITLMKKVLIFNFETILLGKLIMNIHVERNNDGTVTTWFLFETVEQTVAFWKTVEHLPFTHRFINLEGHIKTVRVITELNNCAPKL